MQPGQHRPQRVAGHVGEAAGLHVGLGQHRVGGAQFLGIGADPHAIAAGAPLARQHHRPAMLAREGLRHLQVGHRRAGRRIDAQHRRHPPRLRPAGADRIGPRLAQRAQQDLAHQRRHGHAELAAGTARAIPRQGEVLQQMRRRLVAGHHQPRRELPHRAQHRAEHAEPHVVGVQAEPVVDMSGLREQPVRVGQHADLEPRLPQGAGQAGGAEPVGKRDEKDAGTHRARDSRAPERWEQSPSRDAAASGFPRMVNKLLSPSAALLHCTRR